MTGFPEEGKEIEIGHAWHCPPVPLPCPRTFFHNKSPDRKNHAASVSLHPHAGGRGKTAARLQGLSTGSTDGRDWPPRYARPSLR